MVLGATGVPWDPPDHDLETGLEMPNSSRFCAGSSPNGCWIMFSWVSFRSLSLVLGGHPHLGEAHPHWERTSLSGDGAHFSFPLPSGSLEAPVSHGGFAVPCFWGILGLFWGGARNCAKLPHVLSPSSSPMSPRVAGITLQLPDLPANARMCVSPSSPQLPDPPSLCCSLRCWIGVPHGDRDVFGYTKGVCDVPAMGFYMFY